MPSSFAIAGRRVVMPSGVRDAIVVVSDGKISRIEESKDRLQLLDAMDFGDLVIMPALVDSHVHVNQPGRAEWEGFEHAGKAALAGGICTIADMPLNSRPVTTTVEALTVKLASALGELWVDCAFWGGLVPGNQEALEGLIDRGVAGFKCFLIHSGVDEFPEVSEADLHMAMPILAERNIPLLVHAELQCGEPNLWIGDHRSYQSFLESRPRRWENEAIKLMVRLSAKYDCPVHIVHLSSSEALPIIREAKRSGFKITCETCPHYLTFAAEEIPDGDARFKCMPPVRQRENRERLWEALLDGTIDFIVSDHSPCSPELKLLEEGDLKRSWGGISSLQFGLSAVWTEARKRGADLADIARWMCSGPAGLLKLTDRKGRLAEGCDADLVIWSPEESRTVEPAMIYHRHRHTPYEGRRLDGVVKHTYLRGQRVFSEGNHALVPVGKLLVGVGAVAFG